MAMQGSMASGADTCWKVIVATAFGFTIATTAIILRFASRWLCKKTLETNDYFIIVGYIFKLAIDICSVLIVCYGVGRNYTELSDGQIISYLKIIYILPIVYGVCICFVKLSILSLYYSAFKRRYMRYSVYILSVIVVAWSIAVVIVGAISCSPLGKKWHPKLGGKCINYKQYYYGCQIPNIVTDFALLFLPLKAVWDLALPRRQKALMSAVLMLALVTCAFDIVRFVVLLQLNNEGGDFTMQQVGLIIWTNLEPSIAILVACLPICRPLLQPRTFMQLRNQSIQSFKDSDSSEFPQSRSGTKDESYEKSESIGADESPSRNL